MVSIDIVSLKQIRDIEHTAGRSEMDLLLSKLVYSNFHLLILTSAAVIVKKNAFDP